MPIRCNTRRLFFKKRIKGIERFLLVPSRRIRGALGAKIFTYVGRLFVLDPLGRSFPALVMGALIVEIAIEAYVQVRRARWTGISESEPFTRGQLDGFCTVETLE